MMVIKLGFMMQFSHLCCWLLRLFFFVFLLSVVSSGNTGEMFIWMPKEHLYVLVYLVTVMHSMQAGYMNKAQEYTDKALAQIEKLKSEFINQWSLSNTKIYEL